MLCFLVEDEGLSDSLVKVSDREKDRELFANSICM